MKRLMATLNAVCALAVFLCISIQFPAFSKAFYKREYEKQSTPERIKVSMTDLMEVTDKLIGYMSGKEPDLVIEVEVAGERREFFNQKEKAHMVDVKNLMILTIQIRNFALLGFALTLIAYCALKPFSLRTLLSSLRLVVGIGAGLLAILAALMWHSFDKVFVAFHELFFNNDLWLLDYNTDLLLNIVPQDFFIDISMFIGCIFAALVAVAIAATTAGLRYSRMA